MKKPDTRFLPLSKPSFSFREIDEISKVLDSGWVSQGPKSSEFEKAIIEYTGAKHAIAVSNCTSALHLALLSIGVKKGDEVIVADYTFPATGHTVMYCGANPIFADVDRLTYNIAVDKIESKITKRTKAIIPVHTFGQPADMGPIMEIAENRDLKVIEDAACALGAKYHGEFAGTMGDVGCYSFHARKGVTTGEGGMAVTNDKKLAERIRHLSVFGMKAAWDREKGAKHSVQSFTDMGFNYKMSDILAAVGVAQMKRLDGIIRRKQKLAKHWDSRLDEIDLIEKPFVAKDLRHVYQSYVTIVDKKVNRNRLISKLKAKGVQTQIGTYASHMQPVYKSKDACPVSLDLYRRSLALPLYYSLTYEEIDRAADMVEETIGEMK
jgi:dTDP-4-amino-4,6-dideoxygalactose transaminase